MTDPRTDARVSTWRIALRALGWLRPHARAQAFVLGVMVVGTALSLVYPLLVRGVFDEVFERGRWGLLPWLALGIAVTAGTGALLSALAGYRQVQLAAEVLLDLRTALFGHLQRLDLERLEETRLGDLLARLGGDLNEVQQVATATVAPLAGATLTLLGAVALLAWISPTLLLVALVCAVPGLVLVRLLRPRVLRQSMDVRERNADLGSRMVESLSSGRTVRAAGTQELEVDRFRTENRRLVRAVLRFQRTAVTYGVGGQLLLVAAGLAVLLVGANLVRQGDLTVGDLVAFSLVQARLFRPVQGLAATAMNLYRARASLQRVFDLLDRPLSRTPSTVSVESIAGELTFDDVSFGYPSAGPLLQGVSFRVPAGERLAVVGPSGAGKSTVVDLLLGLRRPDGGEIRVDGHDLGRLDPAQLLPRMALVSQRPTVWTGTLRENLLYGLPDRSDAELWEALDRVGLGDDLRREARGLDAHLGQRGNRLSEGQRQRLGLAHALVRRPVILVLDEVTSALDWRAEDAVLDLLDGLSGRCTCVLVTHRPAMAARADRVVVLDGGRVVQSGSPGELARETGAYREWLDR